MSNEKERAVLIVEDNETAKRPITELLNKIIFVT